MRTSHPMFTVMFLTATGLAAVAACGDNDGPDGDEPTGVSTSSSKASSSAMSSSSSGTMTSQVGGACKSAADCGTGLTACNEDPGGQCTKPCGAQKDCDAVLGAVCETQRPGNCYKACKTKADCPRAGYDCVGGPNPEAKMWCDVVK